MVAHSFQQKHIGLVLQGADVWLGSPNLNSPSTIHTTACFGGQKHHPFMGQVSHKHCESLTWGEIPRVAVDIKILPLEFISGKTT